MRNFHVNQPETLLQKKYGGIIARNGIAGKLVWRQYWLLIETAVLKCNKCQKLSSRISTWRSIVNCARLHWKTTWAAFDRLKKKLFLLLISFQFGYEWQQWRSEIMLPLTLLMLKLEYSGITRSILWLQMLWCWLGGIKGSLSSTRKDFKHLSRNYGKCKNISISSKKFSESRVKTERIAADVCGHQGSGICCIISIMKVGPEQRIAYVSHLWHFYITEQVVC